MLPALARISVAALCLIGLLVQSLGAGLDGRMLCIGCEGTGWTIAGPEAQTGPRDCCDHESESNEPKADQTLKMERRCGCVAIPLAQGLAYSVASPRSETHHEVVAILAIPIVAVVCVLPECPTEIWARAGPTHPPRLLSPFARRTVLVI